MANAYTGEVEIIIGGLPLTMQFNWRALATVHQECGPNAIKDIYNLSAEDVAKIIHAGLKKHHPEVTLDMVMDGAPPLIPALAKLDQAISFAYFGTDSLKPADGAEDDSKKK